MMMNSPGLPYNTDRYCIGA